MTVGLNHLEAFHYCSSDHWAVVHSLEICWIHLSYAVGHFFGLGR